MYRINELFVSLQGEGYFTGTPSIFIRFSGCNLKCPFCDTQHAEHESYTLDALRDYVAASPVRHVVLTGGEPALQIDEPLIDMLHGCGKFIAVETNGTQALPSGIDWITLSPKTTWTSLPLQIRACHELKVVFCGQTPDPYADVACLHRFLQPCDTGDAAANAELHRAAVDYCLQHPQWRLSLQTHKMLHIR